MRYQMDEDIIQNAIQENGELMLNTDQMFKENRSKPVPTYYTEK